MKRIIPFSKYFIPAAILSIILAGSGAYGFLRMGFNLGIDFQAGLIQEIQFAPPAMHLTYDGPGNALISLSRTSVDIIISGAGIEDEVHVFSFTSYPTQGDLIRGFNQIEGMSVSAIAPASASSSWLIQSALSSPRLETDIPFIFHYLRPDAQPVRIEDVRATLLPLGTASVQVLGDPAERRFMIRMEDSELDVSRGAPAERVITTLENRFGQGEVVVTRSDFVGARFARQLTEQAWWLITATLILILAYCSLRFKFQFALGAVIGIMHAAIIAVAFVVWTRMEFNTITIAALMTVVGYAINDTIVVYDRMRETRRIYPDDAFVDVLNRAITETLNRTIITTFTTMLAVTSLLIFTTGGMQDFAAVLLVGMAAGVYSTIFIASGVVYAWELKAQKRAKKKQLVMAGAKT